MGVVLGCGLKYHSTFFFWGKHWYSNRLLLLLHLNLSYYITITITIKFSCNLLLLQLHLYLNLMYPALTNCDN